MPLLEKLLILSALNDILLFSNCLIAITRTLVCWLSDRLMVWPRLSLNPLVVIQIKKMVVLAGQSLARSATARLLVVVIVVNYCEVPMLSISTDVRLGREFELVRIPTSSGDRFLIASSGSCVAGGEWVDLQKWLPDSIETIDQAERSEAFRRASAYDVGQILSITGRIVRPSVWTDQQTGEVKYKHRIRLSRVVLAENQPALDVADTFL